MSVVEHLYSVLANVRIFLALVSWYNNWQFDIMDPSFIWITGKADNSSYRQWVWFVPLSVYNTFMYLSCSMQFTLHPKSADDWNTGIFKN